ncbi:MAG: hypothetical protein Q8P50_07655 [Bacillota bacterium]|nr:hypothetical protein [Bacillota bacterium]
MDENLYQQKLVWFKQNERPEIVLLIADDAERVKIVIAWTNLNVRRADKLTALKSESENDVWEWLWQNCRYSRSELMEKAGMSLSESMLERKMKPLIGNRVVYPDGTVNSFVQRYLRDRVLKLFEPKLKRQKVKD